MAKNRRQRNCDRQARPKSLLNSINVSDRTVGILLAAARAITLQSTESNSVAVRELQSTVDSILTNRTGGLDSRIVVDPHKESSPAEEQDEERLPLSLEQRIGPIAGPITKSFKERLSFPEQ